MTQAEQIISLLNTYGEMTQGKLAEAIYGDKKHISYVYSALKSLVKKQEVIRSGAHPAIYSLQDDNTHECISTASYDTDCSLLSVNTAAMTQEEAIKLIREYFNETVIDPHGRYFSWVHCYKAFCKNRGSFDEGTVDYLSLHLAFYLASWGMYRGSSFLFQKDYRVHEPIVRIILEKKYDHLLGIGAEALQMPGNLLLLQEISARIKQSYAAEKPSFEGTINNATDTLVTKILLGTLGCVPAYDRYYIQAVKKRGISSEIYDMKSISAIAKFYCKYLDGFEKLRKELSAADIEYPPMKLMDMCFWQDAFSKSPKDRKQRHFD